MARTPKRRARRRRGRLVARLRSQRLVGVRRRVPRPSAAALPPTTGAPPTPVPAAPADPMVYSGAFGRAQAERLLWRAGFGPAPGQAEALAAKGLTAAVQSLTRPSGTPTLTGPEPRTQSLPALQPRDLYLHDHLWWLDRMVRTDQPLVERMALIWHDWFATSDADVDQQGLIIDQNELFRRHALGSFADLLRDVTIDPAMLVFLNGVDNRKGRPNENYARELMELFTLGADRGAYTEQDIRQAAMALTGWRADWVDPTGWQNFRFDANRREPGTKTIFGQSGDFGWQDACRLCLEHPLHPSFFVRKLWSAFIPHPPDATTQAALEARYIASGHGIRDVVEAILLHPDLYLGSPLVKPPAVFSAGLLRALGKGVDSEEWANRSSGAGQRLFHPPNVAGWNDEAWLDTSTLYYRWRLVSLALSGLTIANGSGYSRTETPEEAVAAALRFWGDPALGDQTRSVLLDVATKAVPATATGTTEGDLRGQRQNALRHLLAAAPDLQVC